MGHGHRPQLPEIFPSGDDEIIHIEGEKHRFEVFQDDFGDPLPKYEYTLNKAPVELVEEVTGFYDGQAVTFTEGADYALAPLVSERTDSFSFDVNESLYTLTTSPNVDSTSIEDESGDTYAEDVDYALVETDGTTNTIDWSLGGDNPDDGETFTVAYDVTFEDAVIDWEQGGRTPDAGTIFSVTYRATSLISRYIEESDRELNNVEDELDEIIRSKFIDNATGEELDNIGAAFGQIGKRAGRNDTQYRIYLKSVVQSFVSRGTVSGIKAAISAATDVPLEDIQINEDFDTNTYEVQIVAATPITGSLLEEVSEIADPSGVGQTRTRFTLPADETAVSDAVSFTEGQLIEDDMAVADTAAFFNKGVFDIMAIDDALAIDPNKFAASDEMSVTDALTIDPNTFSTSDTAFIDDEANQTRGSTTDDIEIADEIVTLDVEDKDQFRWETDDDPTRDTEWDFFQWTELQDFVEAITDELATSDAVVIDPNTNTVPDEMGSADANVIDANKHTVADVASTDDAVNIVFNGTKVAEDTGSADAVPTITTQSVAWGTEWETFNWAKESN